MSNFDQAITGSSIIAGDVAPATLRRVAVLRDRLTIFRMLVIVTTVTIGIVVYGPERAKKEAPLDFVEWGRILASSVVIGLSLAGPVFAVVRARTYRLGAGGLLALTLGLGCLVMLPPAAAMRFRPNSPAFNSGAMCLYYCIPLVCLWYLAAMAAGGRISRRSFSPAVPFSERYGLLLALLGSPLGLWLMWDFYREAFF